MIKRRKPKQLRHGDYYLIEPGEFEFQDENGITRHLSIPECPAEAMAENRHPDGRAIVGEGEFTGHHHAVAEKDVAIRTLDGLRWLDVPNVAHLKHEEHNTIQIPAGAWFIQQERTYNSGEIERVVD